MIAGYLTDVEDVLRAAIAIKRDPSLTLVYGKNKEEVIAKLRQYRGEAQVMISDLVPHVPQAVKLKLRERPPRCCGRVQPSLHGFIAYSLRHRRCVPGELVRLLSSYYPDLGQVLARRDGLSLKYFHMFMEVQRELDRLREHTRPRPAGGLMYVEISPEHDIVDLYLEWMARRISDRASVVKAKGDYFLVNANYLGHRRRVVEISAEEVRRLIGDLQAEDHSVWEQYYDSQMIEHRRNKALAKKVLPAKYSYMSPEVRLERIKIEHGIPRHCLSDFFKS